MHNPSIDLFYSATVDPLGAVTQKYADAIARTVRTVYSDGSFTETLYGIGSNAVTADQEGDVIATPTSWTGISNGGSETVNLAQRKSGDPIVATYDVYDQASRLVDVYQPAVLDGDSPNSTQMVNPHWHYGYDTAGNEIMQTSPTGHNASGQVIAGGNTTTFGYDQNGNQVRQTLPNGESESWTYNINSQVATFTDFDGNVATYTYATSGTQASLLQQVVYAGARICSLVRCIRCSLSCTMRSPRITARSPKLEGLTFEPLPNPFSRPEQIISPSQVSILYLGGYDHVTQCSIAAITLETLFEFRASLTGRIPPFLSVVEEAHTFIPSAREGTEDAVSLPVIRRIITEGRKFGTGLMLISQRPSRLDETIVAQCNSYLILRLVNPKDQNFVRAIMENLTEADARMIPGFGPGQGIVSGQIVRFPLPVKVDLDEELRLAEIGDEDFFEQAEAWQPDAAISTRDELAGSVQRVSRNRARRKR